MLETISISSTFVVGLFTGALLTEGVILVPYWTRMPPAEFIRLHQSLGPSLFRYFAPLTSLAVALSVITAILDQGQTIEWMVAALLCLFTLAIFFIYFKKANASFKSGDISEETLPKELTRWTMWHWVRTCLMLAALLFSILGHT